MASAISDLQLRVREFGVKRDWTQFHAPKNLACAIAVEAAELLEQFQWMSEKDSEVLSAEKKEAVALEMADVFIYLLNLADRMEVDLVDAAKVKLAINEARYPVEKSKGRSDKYNEL